MVKTKSPIIEVENLEVIRSNNIIIENAWFKIYRGDYVGVVGPNGGGKTTLLLALLNLIPYTKGLIRLFGDNIKSFSNWEKVAYVSQDAINFDSSFPLNVKELVSLGRINPKNLGRRLNQKDWTNVNQAIEFMGISELTNKRLGMLSGGQKQRVFVAKAIVRNPEILIMDEPIVGIDAKAQESFFKKLSDLNIKRKLTILLVSHDLTAVFCRMSKIMCVNREVNVSKITKDLDPDTALRKAYGRHFHFVFHKHKCDVGFNDD